MNTYFRNGSEADGKTNVSLKIPENSFAAEEKTQLESMEIPNVVKFLLKPVIFGKSYIKFFTLVDHKDHCFQGFATNTHQHTTQVSKCVDCADMEVNTYIFIVCKSATFIV